LAVETKGTREVIESPTNTMTLTTLDNGQEVSVSVGNTLVLRLEAKPGTGYGWQVVRNGAPQLQLEGPPQFESRNNVEAGGVEDEVFSFRVQEVGTTEIECQYRRPWDKEGPTADTFRIRITIE
jgi:inhibitor of cysteine peptidase